MKILENADWIGPAEYSCRHPVLFKDFYLKDGIGSATLHVCGVGLFEAYVNGEKAGNEYLAPQISDYKTEIQVMSYDVTPSIARGDNRLEIMLGNGWYAGRFGLSGKDTTQSRLAAIATLAITIENGGTTLICTDNSWKCRRAYIIDSGIYDGEIQDYTVKPETLEIETINNDKTVLVERFSPPVVIKERLVVKEIIRTPKGETVLDFGQNFAGWVEFSCAAIKGAQIKLEFGEVLQNGSFYNENYRSATGGFIYISDGKPRLVRPHFTYFGFRYVRVSGWEGVLNAENFSGCVVYSDIKATGGFSSGHAGLNRLFQNSVWSQKSNYISMPTDCPQRDERLGWTGDAQVFCRTACVHFNCGEFLSGYLRTLRAEQVRMDGGVPCYIPDGGASGVCAVWGDAATIIPHEIFDAYGDLEMLERHYPMMRDWVDYITRQDIARGEKNLYDFGMQLGDWLALDGQTQQSMKGGTEDAFVASAYYFNSAKLAARAAVLLGKNDDGKRFSDLSEKIKNAMLEEYFTLSGRLAVNTQTAYILSLNFGIYREKEPIFEAFKRRLHLDCYEIKCGFVGAPLLCQTLAENGMEDIAYHILLGESYPGWLHCVNLGATTIWERWNSLLPDGTCSGTGMNSFNHYAFGSIAEFLYTIVAGLKRTEAGWKSAVFEPLPNPCIGHAECRYSSVSGVWESAWKIEADGKLSVRFVVPQGCTAMAILPAGESIALTSGLFEKTYTPSRDFRLPYSKNTLFSDMRNDKRVLEILQKHGLFPAAGAMQSGGREQGTWTLSALRDMFFLNLDPTELEAATQEITSLVWEAVQ